MKVEKQLSATKTKQRRHIMDVALSLFSEKGISVPTIREIATVAKVDRQTIYNYFDSKEELATELLKEIVEKQYRIIDEVELESEKTGYELLKEYIKKLPLLSRGKEEFLFTLHYDYYFSEYSRLTEKSIFSEYKKETMLYRIFEKGKKDGSIYWIKDDMTANHLMLRLIIYSLQMLVFREAVFHKEFDEVELSVEECLDSMIRMFGTN